MRAAFTLQWVRVDEQHVVVIMTKRWWIAQPRTKLRQGARRLMRFEFDATGMGEDDIARAALSDALVYLGGGPDA